MFEFLQGFAYGLFMSCLPWSIIGMIDPRVAVPTDPPTRWRAIVRYWFGAPFLAFGLWLTSLWGGFDPSLFGWLVGLGAIAIEVPVERRWHRWQYQIRLRRRQAIEAVQTRRERARKEREQREQGVAVLDPQRPPVEADEIVLALCRAKQALLDARRADLASQADRLYTRYARVTETLGAKFHSGEITLGRSRAMVGEVCLTAVDNLNAMSSLAAGVLGIDTDYVRHRLQRNEKRLLADEKDALLQRLDLVADTEQRLRELSARNESAMTTLDNAAVVMSRVQTDRPQASVATGQALADLKRFLDRAERYEHEA